MNKVWFWMAFVGLMTAFLVDSYEMAAVKKHLATKCVASQTEAVIANDIETAFIMTFEKGKMESSAFNLKKGDSLATVQAKIMKNVPLIDASLETLAVPEKSEDPGYIERVKFSVIEQLKGQNYEDGMFLEFATSSDGLKQYGKLKRIAFRNPVIELGLSKRNVTYNASFKPYGRLSFIARKIVDYAQIGVELAIGLVGIMALWLGLMRIAEKAGLINVLARVMAPVMRLLFPDVPSDHPAVGSMLLNISAGVLGLGNAATPLGIKAMEELQDLNPHKEVASNAMCTLLVINTAGFAILPATVIGVRVGAGSSDPFGIILPAMVASATSTIVGLTMAKVLEKFFPYDKAVERHEAKKNNQNKEEK